MADKEIDRILINSSKAELLEKLGEGLLTANKAIVVLVEDKENGACSSTVFLLGIYGAYEAYGILELARQDILEGES